MPQTNLADVTKFRVKPNVVVESPTTIRLDVVSPGTITDQWYLPAAIGQTVLFRAQVKTTATGQGQGCRLSIDIYNSAAAWVRTIKGAFIPWGTTSYVQAPECSTVFQSGDGFCDIVLEAVGETAGSSAWFTNLEFYVLNPGESPPGQGGGTPPPPEYGTNNLAHIPEKWWTNPTQPGTASYVQSDNAVFYANAPSIRLDPNTSVPPLSDRYTTLLAWNPIVPGQHVVARVQIKVDSLAGYTFDPNNPGTWHGARIGLDFYDAQGYIGGVSGPHGTLPQPLADSLANWVGWGSPGWNYRQIDMIVPATVASEATGTLRVPTQIVMWLQCLNASDNARAWFSDAELYILNAGENAPSPIPAPPTVVLDIWQMNGGTTNPTGTQNVNTGAQVSITATPNQGYTFTGWLVNNQPVSANPLALTITGNTTVIPQFQTIPTFTLTIIPSVGGKTDLAGAVSVKAGDNTVVQATADQGYVFDHWLFDGQDQTAWFPTSTFTLWNAQANHTLQAVFTVATQVPTMAGSSTAFLLVLGGITVGGLVIGLTRGKKRTQRRSK